MQGKAWAYYSSAADDEIAVRENHAAYHRYVFRVVISQFVFAYLILFFQNMVSSTDLARRNSRGLVYEDIGSPFKYARIHRGFFDSKGVGRLLILFISGVDGDSARETWASRW